MLRRSLTAAAMVLALGAALPAPAFAQGDISISFPELMKMADKNKDGMVSRQEFVAAMGAAYDMHMKRMKSAKDAAAMVKGDMLSAAAVRMLLRDLYPGGQ
ncbi:MAG TPA: EF-hand domain-containing protein [Burkholderiaceae bacterium]|jgi:hypothetical protein|nr:EF-hand domain-containing protein [Burkholderiaceae bacterium]